MKKQIISLILMLLSLGIYSQINSNHESKIVNCLEKEFLAVNANIETEFNILIDTLLSQGILSDKEPESIYDLYNMIRYIRCLNYRNTYKIDLLEGRDKLFYDCVFLFKSDTSLMFKKTKLFKFYTVLGSLENGPSIITFVNDIQRVLEPKDMNNKIYKYYTLYLFYSLFTVEKSDLSKSDIDIPTKQIINIKLDHEDKIYINNKKVNKNRIEASIDKILIDNKECCLIKIVTNKETPISSVLFILKIVEEKNIKVKIETNRKN